MIFFLSAFDPLSFLPVENLSRSIAKRPATRDQIHIDGELASMIQGDAAKGKPAAEDTILLVARQIDHGPDGYPWHVPDYNLVIVADQYDAGSGSLDLSPGAAAANATTGAQGSKGVAQP